MEESKAFKHIINQDVVHLMSDEFHSVYKAFPQSDFIKISSQLDDLELKARVLLITHKLRETLPQDYPDALKLILKVMKRGKLEGFHLWPFSEFIGQFGLSHVHESMEAMYLLTQKFTSEFAIRTFLHQDHHAVLKYFEKWVQDPNHHVRRWVSEGTRPLLPWGLKLTSFVKDPSYGIKLLDQLKYDEELYVRKSVANHLNDISKHHPKLITDLIKRWLKECPPEHAEKMRFIQRQALRTLIKKGNKDALMIMGVSGEAKIKISEIKLNQKKYKIGDRLEFQFKIKSLSTKKQKLVIDYAIDFIKANGKKSAKVFKLKSLDLDPEESVIIKKSHSLKAITTMVYYRGIHHLFIQVNGKKFKTVEWDFRV